MRGLFICLTLLILSLSAHSQQDDDERLARDYFADGAFDKALEIYQKLYNNGTNPEYYDQYFSLLLQTKKFTAARELTSKLMASEPCSPAYVVDLGRVYQQEGLKAKTDSLYKTLFRKLPADEFSIREIAAAFYRANAYDHAITAFTYGRKVLGNDEVFAFDLLALYRYMKDKEKLIQEYIHVLSFHPEETILHQAENSFSALMESDADYALLEVSLQRALKKKTSQPALTRLLSWTYIQQERHADALNSLISLDKRTGLYSELIFNTGSKLMEKKVFKEALVAFEHIVTIGSSDAFYLASRARILYCKMELLSRQKPNDEDIEKLSNEYRAFVGQTADVDIKAFLLQKLAEFNAYHLRRYQEASSLLQEALALSGLPQETKNTLKLELGDVSLLSENLWDATLLYSQVEKDAEEGLTKQEARFRNAKLSYYRGDFVWAQAQLNDLKVTTNQMLANDALNLSLLISEHTESATDTLTLQAYAKADMMVFTKRFERALSILDSMETTGMAGSLADDMMMLKAKIHLDQNNYAEAAEILQQVTERYSTGIWADDALFLLGDTYQTLKESDKAKACYEKIITDYPGSLYISEARIRFRNLRGDSLG